MKDKATPADDIGQTAASSDPSAIYEVVCDSVEIDALICYRTHRLRLPKSRAEELNKIQPDSLRFVGI